MVGADTFEVCSIPSLHEPREARRQRDIWPLLEDLASPTIMALYGFCLGAGVKRPFYCDLHIDSEGTNIALPEATLGYCPSVDDTQRSLRIAR